MSNIETKVSRKHMSEPNDAPTFLAPAKEGGKRATFFNACLVLVWVIACSHFALAQSSDPNVQFTQGDVKEGTSVSLGVPIRSYKGRGLDLPISLSYSSNLWRLDQLNKIHVNGLVHPVTQAIYAEHSVAGWKSTLDLPTVEFPKQTDSYDYRAQPYPSATFNGCFGYRIARLYIHMPDGSKHEFRKSDPPYHSTIIDKVGTFYAVDGSRMRYDSTGTDTGTLFLPDGTRFVLGHPVSSIIDKNGNTQTFNETTREWTDTVGRVIANPLPAATLTQPGETYYKVPDLNGSFITYTLRWRNLSDSLTLNADGSTPGLRYLASHFLPDPNALPTDPSLGNAPQAQSSQYQSLFQTMAPGDVDDPDNPPVEVYVVGKAQSGGQLFNPVVLQEIILPDGTSYQYRYNVYGEINKVIYPTTAFEKYEYASSLAGVDQNKQPYIQADRRATSRQLSANGLGTDILEWKYIETVPFNATGNPVDNNRFRVISIIAPDKTRSEIYRYDIQANDGTGKLYWPFDFASALQGLVFQTKTYSTSADGLGGQLLRRELTQYEQRTNTFQFSVTCGQTQFNKMVKTYRTPRPIKKVNLLFEGTGPALVQTATVAYETSGETTTGVDPTLETTSQYAVVDNAVAQNGSLAQLPVGSPAKSVETTYLNSPTEPNSSIYLNKNILGVSAVTKVREGGATGTIVSQSEMRYDDGGYSPEVGRALPTSWRTWDSTKGAATDPNAYLTTHAKFDNYGNRVEATDAKGYVTLTEYDSTHHAFPVKTTSQAPDPDPGLNPDGLAHGSANAFETFTDFDYTTGLLLSTTDVNGQTTRMEYVDPFLRLTRLIPPAGGAQMISEYGLGTTEATRYVKVKKQTDANNWKEATSYYDGIGRTIKTKLNNSNGDVITETQYDNMGRVQQVTNPYRAGETVFWTTTTYDDLGRVTKITAPDSSKFQTSYDLSSAGVIGTLKTNTDQAGKKRSGISDSLGRMVRVIEDPATQNLITDYVFDTLGNLRETIQGEQFRYFMYDSLGRVLYSKQPEQEGDVAYNATDPVTGNTHWSAKFTYDDNGNNIFTADAKGSSVSLAYDGLNRLIYRNYSDATPDVGFFFDGTGLAQAPNFSKGKTTKVSSSVSESRFTEFDNLGRIKSSQQITNGVIYNFADYSYDLAGDLISQTYPSGRVVKNTLDANAGITKVESQKNSSSPLAVYLDQIKYNASGAVTQSMLGNQRWETIAYNNRLEITQIGLGSSPSDTNLLKIEYGYGAASENNGALREQKISAPGMSLPVVQSYSYDDLNRLGSAVETYNAGTPSWKQTFVYDRFGNRRFDAANTTVPSGGPQGVDNPLINTSDNRFSAGQGYVYDKVGSVIQDADSKRFVYDAEGRQTQFFKASNNSSTPDATYSYDGVGKRVRKTNGQVETIFVYDASGELVAEYSTEPVVNPKVSFVTADHLGSPRIVTDQNGQVISRHDYRGFGEEVSSSYANRNATPGYGADDGIRQQFTGYERDTESGLDYAQARYYNSRHGRFTSADPLTASATIRNPQTFNRYSYVTNSPYKFTDPLGLFGICPGGGQGQGLGGFTYTWDLSPSQKTTTSQPPPDTTPQTTPENTPQALKHEFDLQGRTYTPITHTYEEYHGDSIYEETVIVTVEIAETDVVNTNQAVNNVLNKLASTIHENETTASVARDGIAAKGLITVDKITLGTSIEFGVKGPTVGVSAGLDFHPNTTDEVDGALQYANGRVEQSAITALHQLQTPATGSGGQPRSLSDTEITGLIAAGIRTGQGQADRDTKIRREGEKLAGPRH
jgi:RHS repeat-associated protein